MTNSHFDLASRLRHRITIEQPEMTEEEGGQFSLAWEELATVWAEILPLAARASEHMENEQRSSSNHYRITIRFRSDVTTAMRMVFGGAVFNIRSVICPEERREVLEILAEAGVAM